jgi:hypothetical protein
MDCLVSGHRWKHLATFPPRVGFPSSVEVASFVFSFFLNMFEEKRISVGCLSNSCRFLLPIFAGSRELLVGINS